MKVIKIALFCLLIVAFIGPIWWYIGAEREENDPDLPAGLNIDKQEYLRHREEYIGMIRGLDTAKQDSRSKAVREMEESERQLAARRESEALPLAASWRFLGPAPIPNGQTTGRTDPVSGRTISMVVHPTNPNIVYAGTAQGGLYRSLNGGTTWTPLMDNAETLEIGALAFVPGDPTTLFVGTGESGFCGDCFFGAGVYRISNADSGNPTLSGPFRLNAASADVFSGRSVGQIVVNPNNPNLIYVATVSGTAGIAGSTTGATLPDRGLYRSINALSANPIFEKVTVSAASPDRPILDAVFEPGNPNRMFVTLVDTTGHNDGGVYFTSNALDAAPTFTRVMTTGVGAELGRAELAIQKSGNNVTVYCAHGTSNGQISKATYDTTSPGTPNLNLVLDNNFCNGQCFYDIAVAVDPTDPMKVYLAGSPTLPFGRSTNGGTSFTTSATGLHVDSHVIAVAPSDVNTIYFGSDGGVWKSTDAGLNWVSQNNSTYSATQFESIAVHPNDRHYTLGGTQDNGTEYLFPDGTTWTRSVAGDGGYVVIDSNSTSPTNVVSYHTFFNQTSSQIGFSRSTTTQANGNPVYGNLLGCGGTSNGINCADATLFYAPLVLGPNATGSTGNTVYFGTNKLYRSINQGTTMTAVSQTFAGSNERVSAIGISPQNDDIRLAGTTLGKIYYSNTSAATTMNDITGTVPARLVGRIVIAPNNSDTAYVALGGFGIPNQHVMKTTNLSAATPTWTNAGNGIPDVPTNGLVIDPQNPQTLYAGTDIGVFRSTDGGANWTPFSDGLPKVAVFEIEIQPTNHILKIGTHGRGIWEYNLNVTTRRVVADFDGDARTDLSVFRPTEGNWYSMNSSNGAFRVTTFGLNGDQPVPGDYDGDGKTDIGIFRAGVWYVLNSSNSSVAIEQFGISTDKPVSNDYDGDSKTDLAVFRDGIWYIHRSMDGGFSSVQFGIATDTPVPSDFDGDGKADLAVARLNNSTDADFYILKSSNGMSSVAFWGSVGDLPVIADYDGDGMADVAVFRPSDGNWYIQKSTGGSRIEHFGSSGDIPVQGNYDGDTKADLAVFRPTEGNWYILNSLTSAVRIEHFGLVTDTPLPPKHNP